MINLVKHSNVTSFGGIHLIHQEIGVKKVAALIDQHLGHRARNAQYSYSDLILNMSYTAMCGGDCAEDINYLQGTFHRLKGLKVPSADTILNLQKELSTPVEVLVSANGIENKININDKLNELMTQMALHLGLLNTEDRSYTFDFDHQFIATEKYDAVYSYKKQRGYFPGVACINNIPVYIENRNGNCHVSFNQLETFKRASKVLANHSIFPNKYRMDSGSYIKEITDYIHNAQKALFYIRAEQCSSLLFTAANCETDWKACRIGMSKYQVNSFDYQFGKSKHRIVVYRWLNKTGQQNIITGDAYCYLFIITNDRGWNEKQIIEFYNQRGNSERMFDIQNNDFNWNKLPFSDMQYNTVYLQIMAMCNIIYQQMIKIFSDQTDLIEVQHRLKKFIFRLICIPAKVIRTGRRQIVKLFTGRRIITLRTNTS